MKVFFSNIHSKLKHVFTETKFGKFWLKAHLQFLALALLMYAFKATLYFIIAYIPSNPIIWGDIINAETDEFHYWMEIDNQVPFISYFYFFYLLYYVLPEIFLWILSFYDRKKMVTIVVATMASTVIACICFLIQQVKMLRPEHIMAEYADFSKVTNLDTFWRWAVNLQYHADETALNCFPSLHATVGMALSMVGIWTGKDEKHFPIGLRIFCGLFGVGIVMSTFFVKQHYFVDAIVGAALMAALYFIFKYLIVPPYLRKKEAKMEPQEVATENQ